MPFSWGGSPEAPRRSRRSGTLRYAALAGACATTISATVGTTALALLGDAPWAEYGRIWATWWLGDATGALVVGPPLILAFTEPPPRITVAKVGEGALLLVGLVAAGLVVFRGLIPAPLLYLCLPFPFWAAFRFGRREAALCALVLSGLAVRGTVRGFGPFVGGTPNESLLLLQVFMAVLCVMVLAVATVVEGIAGPRRAVRGPCSSSTPRRRRVWSATSSHSSPSARTSERYRSWTQSRASAPCRSRRTHGARTSSSPARRRRS